MGLGWLAGTAATDGDDRALGWRLSEPLRALGGSSLLDRGNRHYAKGVRADDWRWVVMWGGQGGAAGTVFVEVRQTVWESSPPVGLAPWLLGEVRATRIDLACDVVGVGASRPLGFFERMHLAESRTHRRGWELSQRGDGGEKLTIGSRSSLRYLRIYTKGTDRVRHELEFKGTLARAIAEELRSGASPGAVFRHEYGRIVVWH